MRCYFIARRQNNRNVTHLTYNIWRKLNPNKRININANTLATQRRYIENHEKLTLAELNEIRQETLPETNIIDGPSSTELSPKPATKKIPSKKERTPNHTLEMSEQYKKIIQKSVDDNSIIQKEMIRKVQVNSVVVQAIKAMNEAIQSVVAEKNINCIDKLSKVLYTAAKIISDQVNDKEMKNIKAVKSTQPPWKKRLQKQILLMDHLARN